MSTDIATTGTEPVPANDEAQVALSESEIAAQIASELTTQAVADAMKGTTETDKASILAYGDRALWLYSYAEDKAHKAQTTMAESGAYVYHSLSLAGLDGKHIAERVSRSESTVSRWKQLSRVHITFGFGPSDPEWSDIVNHCVQDTAFNKAINAKTAQASTVRTAHAEWRKREDDKARAQIEAQMERVAKQQKALADKLAGKTPPAPPAPPAPVGPPTLAVGGHDAASGNDGIKPADKPADEGKPADKPADVPTPEVPRKTASEKLADVVPVKRSERLIWIEALVAGLGTPLSVEEYRTMHAIGDAIAEHMTASEFKTSDLVAATPATVRRSRTTAKDVNASHKLNS
jgi:hypothetical protein